MTVKDTNFFARNMQHCMVILQCENLIKRMLRTFQFNNLLQDLIKFCVKVNKSEIAENEHLSKTEYRINRRPHSFSKTSSKAFDWERYIENRKSSIRYKVEHAFRIIKCKFGYRKTAYKGLKKNANRLYALFAYANLYMLAIAGPKLSTLATS